MLKAQNMLLTAIARKIDPSLAMQDITREDWVQGDSVDGALNIDKETDEQTIENEITEDLVRLDIRRESQDSNDYETVVAF